MTKRHPTCTTGESESTQQNSENTASSDPSSRSMESKSADSKAPSSKDKPGKLASGAVGSKQAKGTKKMAPQYAKVQGQAQISGKRKESVGVSESHQSFSERAMLREPVVLGKARTNEYREISVGRLKHLYYLRKRALFHVYALAVKKISVRLRGDG